MSRAASLSLVFLGACSSARQLPAAEAPEAFEASTPAPLCMPTGKSQKSDFCIPTLELGRWLREAKVKIVGLEPTEDGEGGASRAAVELTEKKREVSLELKVKPVPPEGAAFNNDPRKQVAAYALDRLLFDDGEIVVPPTAVRCIPLSALPAPKNSDAEPIDGFHESSCALLLLQLWMDGVEQFERPKDGAPGATLAALGRLNIFVHLIGHRDSNPFNFLQSKSEPRHFLSVDNEIAFSGLLFNPLPKLTGDDWSQIKVDAVSKSLHEALARLTDARLASLLVVTELERRGDRWVNVPPRAPIDVTRGAVIEANRVQLGLTEDEVKGIAARRDEVLLRIDKGELRLVGR